MGNSVTSVRKRNGKMVPFDLAKITRAIELSAKASNTVLDAQKLAEKIEEELVEKYDGHTVPSVEQIQDTTEQILMKSKYSECAKTYILYRVERAKIRDQQKLIPADVQKLAINSKKFFGNSLAEFVYYRTYSRWLESEQRRETWTETVQRYMDFMKEKMKDKLKEKEYAEIQEAVLKMDVMPSMRLLWAAGPAVRQCNISAYNCSFLVPESPRSFAECMYILMCGTGVGFSVERKFVDKLPMIEKQDGKKPINHVIEDSREGWSKALLLGLESWFEGKDVEFDYSKLRPRGARLKTMGGRSSGPEPLKAVLEFSRTKILAHQGTKLTPLDVHDIICKIGEVVVVGGVRRSALLSLSDLNDHDMRSAKTGHFYMTDPQRSMANNSAVYTAKPSSMEFLEEWTALAMSGSGERGIFNRGGIVSQIPKRRKIFVQDDIEYLGCNPCGEIILKPCEFCNLTEVVCRPDDTEETLIRKTELATIIGTYQSTLTDFPFLSSQWKKNCEQERLLGVSITGQWDCPAVRRQDTLTKMRETAIKTNVAIARRFDINPSTAITCVKPSGTVSQMVDAASGMHARHSQYYIRRVRISATDSLFKMLRDQKVPFHPEVGQSSESATTYVLEFPVKAPGRTFGNDLTAIDQLEHWKLVKTHFTEHNPSVTISVGDNEWVEAANWVYENWDIVGGISFLPRSNHVYPLAPYEAITKEQYDALLARFPTIDFSQILLYEKDDETQGAKELACTSGSCELR